MNKLYLIIIFSFLTIFSKSQTGKISEVSFSSDVSAKVVRFYPNPATTIINFEFSKPVQKDYILQVFNFVGKKVFESNASFQKTSVLLTDFYRGIYIFQLRDKTGRIIESGKFQVNK
ncbi:T9SS type A sorting domain-containing protein [Segetibacter koreensis]|uniref:T9SS type A sorting domain-containing protein n=1 Tax=Segetibacter koreensis TaxID=398037 RepID=UPI00037EB9CC|nr:T9SS type A sorting domain-containing protein [Segetibacter koreensis]